MTEPFVVNVFLTVRVFIVGGFLLILPRIVRKGLVFGTYVGEAVADGDAVRTIRRSWNRGCVMLMVLSLLVGYGISLAGRPVAGNLTGTAVLLLSAPLLYLRMFLKARVLAPPAVTRQAEVASASLSAGSTKTARFARIALAVCSLAGLATIVYAAVSYEAIPARITAYSNLCGLTEDFAEKSIVAVMYLPSANFLFSVFFALFGVLMTGAKRSLRAGPGGRSAAAQEAFHAIQVQTFSGTALLLCLVLTILAVQYIRIELSQTRSLGFGLAWACAALFLFMVANLIRILKVSGQGGALLEKGSADIPLTGGLADNAHWILGVFYVNKEDPSMLVESRFGIGYSLNFGNPRAVLLWGAITVLILTLLALPLVGVVK